jgi:hypothetical protein
MDSGEISSSMYATPLNSIELVHVQGVVCHCGLQRGEQTGQVLSECAGRHWSLWTSTRQASRTATSANRAGTEHGASLGGSLGPC